MRYQGIKWWDGQSWQPQSPDVAARIIPTSGTGATATNTTITSNKTAVHNATDDPSDVFTLSGTVKTAAGANIPNGSGTVTIEKWNGTAWAPLYTGIATSSGAWSRANVTLTATTQYRAKFVPTNTAYSASTSGSRTVTCQNKTYYVKTYTADWGASYQSSGAKRTVAECYQGYFSPTNGNQRSAIGFPAAVQSDIGSGTVTKVELYVYADHWGPDSGGTAIIGYHSASSEPATWPPSGLNSNELSPGWTTKTGGKWIDVSSMGLSLWKTGTAKGIAFGPAPGNELEYYGYFKGPGQSNEPKLKVTFYKWV